MHEKYSYEVPPLSVVSFQMEHYDKKYLLQAIAWKLHIAELRTVADGVRDVATWHAVSSSFDRDLEYVFKLGLVWKPIRRVRPVSGFAHRFYEPRPGQPYSVYGVVCREEKYCEKFVRADERGDHKEMGMLLGYPEPDVDFFIDFWIRKKEYDPIFLIALNSGGELANNGNRIYLKKIRPLANIVYRYFGYRPVPHIPRSFTAKDTARFGEKFVKYLTAEEREYFIELLKMPFMWTNIYGVAEVLNDWFVGVANSVPYKELHEVIYFP